MASKRKAQPAVADIPAHARLSASAAERWLNCAGSVSLAEQLPPGRRSSFAAAQGTYAHSIGAACLAHNTTPNGWLGKKSIVDGHEIECDEEMVDGVQAYIDAVDRVRFAECWTELSLTPALSKFDPDLGGTADFVTYCPRAKHLIVVDFKYGSGVFVSAEDNKQLKIYALGAMLAVGSPINTVEVYIVQPRYEGVEPVRKEAFPAWDLIEFAGEIKAKAEATRAKQPELVAGPWCKKTFCPNAATCPALEHEQHALIAAEFSPLVKFDGAKLAEALTAIPLVKARIKAIEEMAYAEAVAGHEIPGFKLVDKMARRQWVDEAKVADWAKTKAVDPYDYKLKSPAQLEKLLKKPEKAEMASLCASVSSGTTLVPSGDARPAISNMNVIGEFTRIGGPVDVKQEPPAFNLIGKE